MSRFTIVNLRQLEDSAGKYVAGIEGRFALDDELHPLDWPD